MIDARLLVPAAAAWLGALAAWTVIDRAGSASGRHAAAVVVLVAAVAAAAAIGTAGVAVRGRPRVRPALIAGSVLVSAILMAALAALRLTPDPVAGWIDSRATSTIEGVITTEPEARTPGAGAPWQAEPSTEVTLASRAISARGSTVRVALPIVVRAPADIHLPQPGSTVVIVGRLRPTPADRGVAASIDATAVRSVGDPGPVDALAHAMRTGLRAALAGTPADAGSLVAGLAVGDETQQPSDLAEDMRVAGLSHLTAVSGGNVVIVVGIALLIAVGLRLPVAARALACAGTLAFYVVLVGPQPSVLRAAAMGAVVLVGIVAGGARGGPPALGVAVIVLVHVWPWLAVSWGFALSVVATGGLLLLAPRVRARLAMSARLRRVPPVLLDAAALTISAQVATAPVLVAMGGAVNWVSVPANLAAMPAVAPVTLLGLVAAAVSPIALSPAIVVAHVAAWPGGWIAWVAHTAATAPGVGPAALPEGWPGLGVLVALAGVAGTARLAGRRWLGAAVPLSIRRSVLGVAIVGTLIVLTLPPGRRGWPPADWLMIMCDVGQGDALLLRAAEGSAVVVDAGPDPVSVDDCLSDAQVDRVPAVVLTHFHADHVGGLSGVLEGRSVGEVLATPIREPVAEAADVDRILAAAGLVPHPMTAGDARVAGDVSWRAVWPRRRIGSGSVPNNASVVLVARIRDRTVLLAGDVEPEAQAAIAADIDPLVLDVVKVPHHGSRYQDPGITAWARADIALVSVGAGNDYGHPAPETLAAWKQAGALVARTDVDGDVAVVRTPSGTGVVARHDMLRSP